MRNAIGLALAVLSIGAAPAAGHAKPQFAQLYSYDVLAHPAFVEGYRNISLARGGRRHFSLVWLDGGFGASSGDVRRWHLRRGAGTTRPAAAACGGPGRFHSQRRAACAASRYRDVGTVARTQRRYPTRGSQAGRRDGRVLD